MAVRRQIKCRADPSPVHTQDSMNTRTQVEELTDENAKLLLVLKNLTS